MLIAERKTSKMVYSLPPFIVIDVVQLNILFTDYHQHLFWECWPNRYTSENGRLRVVEHNTIVWLAQVLRTRARRELGVLADDQTSKLVTVRFALLNR